MAFLRRATAGRSAISRAGLGGTLLRASATDYGAQRANLDRKCRTEFQLLNHEAAKPDARLAKFSAVRFLRHAIRPPREIEPGFAGIDTCAAGSHAVGIGIFIEHGQNQDATRTQEASEWSCNSQITKAPAPRVSCKLLIYSAVFTAPPSGFSRRWRADLSRYPALWARASLSIHRLPPATSALLGNVSEGDPGSINLN